MIGAGKPTEIALLQKNNRLRKNYVKSFSNDGYTFVSRTQQTMKQTIRVIADPSDDYARRMPELLTPIDESENKGGIPLLVTIVLGRSNLFLPPSLQ